MLSHKAQRAGIPTVGKLQEKIAITSAKKISPMVGRDSAGFLLRGMTGMVAPINSLSMDGGWSAGETFRVQPPQPVRPSMQLDTS